MASLNYLFSHFVLWTKCRRDPYGFFSTMGSPTGQKYIDDLWQQVCQEHGSDDMAGFSSEHINFSMPQLEQYPAILIQMPEPRNKSDAYMVCIILKVPLLELQIGNKLNDPEIGYFSLDLGTNFETGGTMPRLYGMQGNTLKHYGGVPEATPEAFIEALKNLIQTGRDKPRFHAEYRRENNRIAILDRRTQSMREINAFDVKQTLIDFLDKKGKERNLREFAINCAQMACQEYSAGDFAAGILPSDTDPDDILPMLEQDSNHEELIAFAKCLVFEKVDSSLHEKFWRRFENTAAGAATVGLNHQCASAAAFLAAFQCARPSSLEAAEEASRMHLSYTELTCWEEEVRSERAKSSDWSERDYEPPAYCDALTWQLNQLLQMMSESEVMIALNYS